MGEVRGLCFGCLRVRIISSLSSTFSLYLGYLMMGSLGSSMMRAHLRQRGWHLCIPGMHRTVGGHVKGLYTYYSILDRLFRKTLTPRDGNTSDITAFQRNLMVAMKPGEPAFNVGDFLWQEIKNSSENPQRLCSYSPYISYIIKKVTQRAYSNDTKHRPLQPKPSRTVRVPSPQDD
jgi:hypothetical protein